MTQTLASAAAPRDAGIAVRSLGTRDPLSLPLFRRELNQRYLIFDSHVSGQRRVDLNPIVLTPAMHEAAVHAAVSVYHLIRSVAERAHLDPAESARYGLCPDTLRLAAASFQGADRGCLARVDLLLKEPEPEDSQPSCPGVFAACEINADCPGGHNEAMGLPQLAQSAGFWDGVDPTTVVPALADRLAALATERDGAVALLYATAYAEDLQVCALLKRALAERGCKAILCPPTAPRRRNGRLRVADEPLAVLYRFFPTEYMAGQRNLDDIAEAIAGRQVRALSGFAEIFTQSKLAFARAWDSALPAEQQRILARHVPESRELSSLPDSLLLAERTGWVLKRALGRVGDEVFVGELIGAEDWARLLPVVRGLCEKGQTWIAQRYVRQRPVPTPFGPRLLTLGAYVLDGRFAGYFARITPESHVTHDALCLPVFVAREVR
jgi:hypothetical protein